jgi:uncharacterized protein involved in exopolysaccharide biosynthesis
MYDSFDAFEYVEYVRKRWRVIAIACGVALLLSITISLLLPKRYTATASVVIEPPGGSDPRAGTAVSAVYLESLKSYETFASSDTLFARAAERFHLRADSHPQAIESLKRSVLKVNKPRDTKILEIRATLPDPKQAQSVAEFVADETVAMSRGESLAADNTFVELAQKQLVDADARLQMDRRAWAELTASHPIDSLQGEIEASVELEGKLRQQLVDAQANVAEYQQTTGSFAREQLQGAQARAALLDRQLKELQHEVEQKSATLARRSAAREALQAEMKVAQAAYEADTTRLRDLRASQGSRAEQLRVIDPGIVPQRPSSPNVMLNVAAALLVALVCSVVYISIAFTYRRRRVAFEPPISRGMRA